MCPPLLAAIPAIAAISSAAGAGVAATGAIVNGVAQANAGAATAVQSRANAVLAGRAATDAEARGGQQVAQVRGKADQVIGEARAEYGASGVDVGSGSAAQSIAADKTLSEVDANTVRNNAAREAWGFKTQSADMLTSAAMAKQSGQNALFGSILTGTGGLLSSGANIYGQGKSAGWWGGGAGKG